MSGNGRDSGLWTASHHSCGHEETLLLSALRDLVLSGEHRLDTMLAAIADVALRLTGASGAALAMWKDSAMVCRARSGETAPALGSHLFSDSGISGQCLRTGKVQHCSDTENNSLVDVEVCRRLGLRSIAVLPIQGWRGINGIVEVFSTVPGAFTDRHLALLDQLASLAERARASQPHGASPSVAKPSVMKPRPSGLLPASDRVGDVAFVFLGGRSRRPLVFGALLAASLLVGFVIWLGWREGDEASGKAHAAAPPSAPLLTASSLPAHIPDNDPIWKPNPGGQPLFPLPGKTSAGTPVKLASKLDVIQGKVIPRDKSLLLGDASTLAMPHRASGLDSSLDGNLTSAATPAEEIITVAPPSGTGQSNPGPVTRVLSANASLPGFSDPASQVVSDGEVVHHVYPAYPTRAKMLRLEGRVILSALVLEDGSVGDLKVIDGNPTLAQSAINAVKQWRYRPFLFDGKPTKRETTVTIDFKLPPDAR